MEAFLINQGNIKSLYVKKLFILVMQHLPVQIRKQVLLGF